MRFGLIVLLASLQTLLDYAAGGETAVAIHGERWFINGRPTNPGSFAEGLLMNVRMVNAAFEDRARSDFNSDANTQEFLDEIPDYAAHGVNAFTLCLQGGMPGYEGAVNSAFEADGSLRPDYLARVERVIRACDKAGVVVILGCYYQRQSRVLRDEAAIRAGIVHVVNWLRDKELTNVLLEIANEYPHKGFVHEVIRDPKGMASLIGLAHQTSPGLLVTASGYGDGRIHPEVAEACDFLTPHWNGTKAADIPGRVAALRKFGKPVACNEDDKAGEQAVAAMRATVESGAGYGLMLQKWNQHHPFHFEGADDDRLFYGALKEITSPKPAAAPATGYFPPPESRGGWRRLTDANEVRTIAGMDPDKLASLREWLLASDERTFAAVVIRRGCIVLEVERSKDAGVETGNVKSCAKAICAAVMAIASEESRGGGLPRRMRFEDRAFDFIPQAQPLSDPRKAEITVQQLLNHTSGVTPESTGVKNSVRWEVILGHAGDDRSRRLAFDPGSDFDYGTHSFYHAALVCETVTGRTYDEYAIDRLLRPVGIERWWFERLDGTAPYGRHASHAIGLSARDLARIAYCMLNGGRWEDRQVIPGWFVRQTAAPTHAVEGEKANGRIAESYSHAWELPARRGAKGSGIPWDARFKPGSGGQLIAFVPSLDLIVTRQTGGSGKWEYEEYLRRACAAVESPSR